MKLTNAKVHRAGRTARTWNYENNKLELITEDEFLELKLSLSSKGGGVTEVKVTIGPDDFAALATMMVQANRGRALREMATTVANELATQADIDLAIIQAARQSVVDAADRAYQEAPAGRDHAERLARDMVAQLVEQLNSKDDAQADDEENAA